jgi:hypothetical protein
MKLLFAISIILVSSTGLTAQTSVYQQQVQSLSGSTTTLSSFAGKKILVALCNPAQPNLTWLDSLNAVSKKDSSTLQIILVPLIDLDTTAAVVLTGTKLKSILVDSLHFNFIISASGYGKKASTSQLPLLKWLTNKNENVHFDYDITGVSQMFVIGGNGLLYAELFGPTDLINGNLTGVLSAAVPNN